MSLFMVLIRCFASKKIPPVHCMVFEAKVQSTVVSLVLWPASPSDCKVWLPWVHQAAVCHKKHRLSNITNITFSNLVIKYNTSFHWRQQWPVFVTCCSHVSPVIAPRKLAHYILLSHFSVGESIAKRLGAINPVLCSNPSRLVKITCNNLCRFLIC